MTEASEDSAVLQLQDILIGAESVDGFLDGLAGFAASTLTGLAGTGIECAVTLKRHRHTAMVAGSSARAIELDHIEQRVGDGPCIRALFTMAPELLNDPGTWPASPASATPGCRARRPGRRCSARRTAPR